MTQHDLPLIGWREYVALPELGIPFVKAKIDTGARSSSLHAVDVDVYQEDGRDMVRFLVHPKQRSEQQAIECRAEVHEFRSVRSSSGHEEKRPVLVTAASVLGVTWPIELTLTDRSQMGFRMLLGREAVRGRFLVHPGRSWFGGRHLKKRRGR